MKEFITKKRDKIIVNNTRYHQKQLVEGLQRGECGNGGLLGHLRLCKQGRVWGRGRNKSAGEGGLGLRRRGEQGRGN